MTLADLASMADIGGALTLGVYAMWELRQVRQVLTAMSAQMAVLLDRVS